MISIEKTYRGYGGKTYQSDSNTSQNILVKATTYVFFVRNEQERQAIVTKKDGRTVRSPSGGQERKRMM
jgi:hypothetical protein